MFSTFVKIKPMPAPRPRFTRNGKVYTPTEYAMYKERIAHEVGKITGGILTSFPVKLDVTFNKKAGIDKHNYGDLDNLLKGVLDALNNVVYRDDAQVTTITARKVMVDDETEEGIWIIIRYSAESFIDD